MIQERETEIAPELDEVELIPPSCSDVYSISGVVHIPAQNALTEYTLISTLGVSAPESVHYTVISQEGDEKEYQDTLIHHFSEPGLYTIRADNIVGPVECEGSVELEVSVYRNVILYIGDDASMVDNSDITSVFRTKSTYLHVISTTLPNFQMESELVGSALSSADTIIFQYSDILGLFSSLEHLKQLYNISFSEKQIYVISSSSRPFLSKVLASSFAKTGIQNISLISPDQLNTLLSEWSFRDNPDATLGETISYTTSGFIPTLGSFFEFLAYSGVSYQLLGFLLSIACVALVYNISKQIVGIYVFGMYYPLVFAVIITIMGIRFTGAFILVALLAIGLTSLITKHVHLLFNARRALLVSIYILIGFLFLGIDNVFSLGIFSVSSLNTPTTLVTLFVILFIVERFLEEAGSFRRLSSWVDVFQYTILVSIACFILAYRPLQYFFITYPDIIFLIVILNVLVGRYTGLQLTEYFRFTPILKSLGEEEE